MMIGAPNVASQLYANGNDLYLYREANCKSNGSYFNQMLD